LSEEIREDALTKLENMQLSVEQGLKVLEMAKKKFRLQPMNGRMCPQD